MWARIYRDGAQGGAAHPQGGSVGANIGMARGRGREYKCGRGFTGTARREARRRGREFRCGREFTGMARRRGREFRCGRGFKCGREFNLMQKNVIFLFAIPARLF